MLTFKDYKVKVKKIINILFRGRIKVNTYSYKGCTIYEDLYAFNDFYCQTPDNKWMGHGSYKQLTKLINRELTSPPVKIHAGIPRYRLKRCREGNSIKELSAQELKSTPIAGYYRWKIGEATTYHCGLARIFYDNEIKRWMCDCLRHFSLLDSVSDAIQFYGPVDIGSKNPFKLSEEK